VAKTYEDYCGTRWSHRCGLPNDVPHATHYVSEMVEFISSLLESGVAYVTSDGVYFDVSRVDDYGLLRVST